MDITVVDLIDSDFLFIAVYLRPAYTELAVHEFTLVVQGILNMFPNKIPVMPGDFNPAGTIFKINEDGTNWPSKYANGIVAYLYENLKRLNFTQINSVVNQNNRYLEQIFTLIQTKFKISKSQFPLFVTQKGTQTIHHPPILFSIYSQDSLPTPT